MNKVMRNLCLRHLQEDALITGLEASADFFTLTVQVYVQENQSLLKLESLNKHHQIRIKSSLTKDEVVVLSHLAAGKTNGRIALDMGVSSRTIANYLKNIRQKLDTQGRSDTIAAAIKLFGF